MKRAILLKNMDEFNELQDRVHKAMIEDGADQERWAEPEFMFIVESRVMKYLNDDDKPKIVAMYTEGEKEKIDEDRLKVAAQLEELEVKELVK